MTGQRRRIAVIGAGIVGTSTALFLRGDGHDVTLIDPLDPGEGTSSGNAGIISLGSTLPIGTPEVLRQVPSMLLDPMSPLAIRWAYLPALAPWLVRFVLSSRAAKVESSSRALGELLAHADRAHDLVIQRAGAGDLVRRVGWLKVARRRETVLATTELNRAAWDRLGFSYQVLREGEPLELEPALNPDLRFGLFLPMNRAVAHPREYVARIAEAFLREGGQYRKARVTGLPQDERRVVAVQVDGGTIDVDVVVIAAGAFSKALSALVGARVPLEAERGYHAMLPHPARTLTRPVYFMDHGFLLAPMRHGMRLTGGVELASPSAPPDWRRLRRLVKLAQDLLPGLTGKPDSEWLGLRPSTPDGLPVIGRAPGCSNAWLAFAHQHIGLTLGPVTGRIIADLVGGRDPGLDLAPFAPDRRFW
jgi:D-amino-acid dehydrogenase